MAAFPARDASSHAAHWATKILAEDTVVARTIVCDGEVAGNVVSWIHDGRREVGYWIGRAFWGRGIASAALAQLVDLLPDRPLHAYVAAHNRGSLRVLEKCGFVRTGTETSSDGVEGVLMELREREKGGARKTPPFPTA